MGEETNTEEDVALCLAHACDELCHIHLSEPTSLRRNLPWLYLFHQPETEPVIAAMQS